MLTPCRCPVSPNPKLQARRKLREKSKLVIAVRNVPSSCLFFHPDNVINEKEAGNPIRHGSPDNTDYV